jgi:hypothetical protein
MDEVVQQLIEAKMKLAETQESVLIKSRLVREVTEIYNKKQEEVHKMQAEIRSLYDSISQLSEERNLLILSIEDSPRAGSIQSLDTVEEDYRILEHHSDQSRSDLWTAVLNNWNKVKTSRKLKTLSRKGIPANIRGQIWAKAIENKLCITPVLYNLLLSKSKAQDRKIDLPQDIKKNLSSTQTDNLLEVLESFNVRLI